MLRAFHKDEMLAGWPIFYYIFRYLVSSNIHHNKLSKLEMRRYRTIKTNKILISKEREKEAASKRYKCTRLTKNYHSMLAETSKTCLTLSIYTCAIISVIPLTNFRYKIFMLPFSKLNLTEKHFCMHPSPKQKHYKEISILDIKYEWANWHPLLVSCQLLHSQKLHFVIGERYMNLLVESPQQQTSPERKQ